MPIFDIKINQGELTVQNYHTPNLKIKKPLFQCSFKNISPQTKNNNQPKIQLNNVKAIRNN